MEYNVATEKNVVVPVWYENISPRPRKHHMYQNK